MKTINRLFSFFGLKLCLTFEVTPVCEELQAFAMEMQAQIDCVIKGSWLDKVGRFRTATQIQEVSTNLVDKIYECSEWEVRHCATVMALVAMRTALEFGALLPRREGSGE